MILSQVSYLDCIAFVIFLIPQLLLQVNFATLLYCAINTFPFLVLKLPYTFTKERYFTSKYKRSPFVQQSSPFQDFVIRCVRYAFAEIPVPIGRVFFSKEVSLPFLRFRMLRHGYIKSPTFWKEIDSDGVKGILITQDDSKEPDVVFFYCHGGGFSMGSAYFYLEPLLALHNLLNSSYSNPAIFALEYTLVPDATYPTQLTQTFLGYQYVLSMVADRASRICVAGDSAGATLILGLLLYMAGRPDVEKLKPGYATLISPWVTLVSEKNQDTPSDYLNTKSLHLYGSQYAAVEKNLTNPLVSPGYCADLQWWANAAPTNGIYITYGSEEVFGPEIRKLAFILRRSKVGVSIREEPAGIHAWVIASLFLNGPFGERVRGLREIVKMAEAHIKTQ